MPLHVDTITTQKLELYLDAADFAKFLAVEDFQHYDLHKKSAKRIESGPMMAKVHSSYLLKLFYNLFGVIPFQSTLDFASAHLMLHYDKELPTDSGRLSSYNKFTDKKQNGCC